MRHKKKWGKLLSGLLLAVVLLIVPDCRAYAEAGDQLFFAWGCDREGNVETAAVAFVLNEGDDYFVITDSALYSDPDLVYSVTNLSTDTDYPIEWFREVGDTYGLGIFVFSDNIPPEEQMMQETYCTKGERVNFIYFLLSEGEFSTVKVVMEDAENGEDDWIMATASAEEEIDWSDVARPGVLVDQNGDAVGFSTMTDLFWTFNDSVEAFYGDAASSTGQEETTAEEKETAPEEKETTKSNTTRRGESETAPEKKTDTVPVPLMILVGMVIGGAMVVVVTIVWKKKKKTPEGTDGVQAEADQSFRPVKKEEDPGPTSIYRVPEEDAVVVTPSGPEKRSYTILGTAGFLMGQRYTIEAEGAVMGRGVSARIRFPADAREISQVHCRLYLREDGALMLEDCNSMNGTYLKHYGRLGEGHPVELKEGSIFCLASDKNLFIVE